MIRKEYQHTWKSRPLRTITLADIIAKMRISEMTKSPGIPVHKFVGVFYIHVKKHANRYCCYAYKSNITESNLCPYVCLSERSKRYNGTNISIEKISCYGNWAVEYNCHSLDEYTCDFYDLIIINIVNLTSISRTKSGL